MPPPSVAVGRFQALSCPALKQFVSVAMARPLAEAVACQSVLVGFLSVSMAAERWRAVSPCDCCRLVFGKCIANGRYATLVAHCRVPPCLLQRYDNHACHAISRGVKIYANGCIRRCRRGCSVAAGCPVALACISACGAGLCRGWRRRPAKRAVWGGRTARFAAWRGPFCRARPLGRATR